MIKLGKNDCNEPQRKVLKFTDFGFPKQEESLSATIGHLTAVDNLPFSLFVTSTELRKSLIARGFEVPKSRETIKAKFMEYYQKCKQAMKEEIGTLKSKEKKFSIAFDEWTSTSNKRYMNIIVYTNGKLFNVGLVRMKKSGTAENCIQYLEDRLNKFGISLSYDVVGFTTDGASTMQKIGKLIAPKQQLCLAHGLHLAVVDVLYKGTPTSSTEQELSSSEDDEDLFECFEVTLREDHSEITERFHIKPVIEKVRKTVRMFRKSPSKNEILQSYVKQEKGKELKLILDCRTRWNTLFEMCQRFSDLEIPVKKALIDLKSQTFSEDEFNLMKQIINILNPIKITLEALCRRDMTLCKADAALTFMLKEISAIKCGFGKDLYRSLRKRIEERRTAYSTLSNFLKNPNKKSDFDNNLDMILIKSELKVLILRFTKIPDTNNSMISLEIDDSVSDEKLEEAPISIVQKLNDAIEECKSPIKSVNKADDDLETQLSKEIDLFVSGGVRGKYLQAAYSYLETILPTSVDCERCFSTATYVGNKIRSRLSDETLDALIFLRNYLKQ